MVIGCVGPLLENAFPFKILLERGKVWHRLNVVDLLVHSAEPMLLFQVVWRIRCVRENGSASGIIILDTGRLLVKPVHFTHILAFVHVLFRNHFDMHLIVVADLPLHDSSHEFVFVQSHPLLEYIRFISWGRLNQHSNGTAISISVVCNRLFIFHFVLYHYLWGTLKLI